MQHMLVLGSPFLKAVVNPNEHASLILEVLLTDRLADLNLTKGDHILSRELNNLYTSLFLHDY